MDVKMAYLASFIYINRKREKESVCLAWQPYPNSRFESHTAGYYLSGERYLW